MNLRNDWRELISKLRIFAVWIVSSVLAAVFTAVWVLLQWLVSKLIANFGLSGADRWMLQVFQVLFAVSTLAPIAIYTYQDITVMFLRAQKRVQEERRVG